jgi:dipeptidyl aminopeptidase/acylaminoacyl peptidase
VDESSGKPLGPPDPLPAPTPAVVGFSLARDGRIALAGLHTSYAVRRADSDPERAVLVGDPAIVYATSRIIFDSAIAPDGASFTMTFTGAHEDLYWIGADGTGLRQLTDDAHRQRGANWAPDGERLVFQSDRNGRYDLWSIRPDGSRLTLLATSPGPAAIDAAFAPDGRRLAFHGGERLWWIATLGENAAENKLEEQPAPPGGGEFSVMAWSPDGALLIGQVGDADGNDQGLFVYAPDQKAYRRVTSEPATFPGCTWLGGSRHAVCSRFQQGLVVVDTTSSAIRTLVEALPSSRLITPSASLDGRYLGWVEVSEESDIWLATFEEPAGVAPPRVR